MRKSCGKGKAVFAGFDGLLQATADGQDSLYFQILDQALDQAHQDNGMLAEGLSQSVRLTMGNLAIATDCLPKKLGFIRQCPLGGFLIKLTRPTRTGIRVWTL